MSSAVLAAMSHDIRTPMNGVLGMAELLLAADDLSDRHRRRVEIIKQSGEKLLGIIDLIIDLSRLEAGETALDSAPFDLREVVEEVVDQIHAKHDGRAVELDLADRHCRFVGDASRLHEILLHFLESAVNFTAKGGLTTAIDVRPSDRRQRRIRLEIRNATIDAAEIVRLLSLMEQGDPLASDSLREPHLALVMCKTLSRTLRGDVGIDNHGAACPVFWLELGLDVHGDDLSAEETSPGRDAPESGGETKTIRNILVAEDNPDMAMLIEDLLEEAGYKTTVAPDGASVLRILDEQPVDVVLMDGRMPDMSGFETTSLIRQLPDERARIPIIALTAEALAGDRERYLSAGMDDYIAKPVQYDALITAIERCGNLPA